jgi:hypothetical protein
MALRLLELLFDDSIVFCDGWELAHVYGRGIIIDLIVLVRGILFVRRKSVKVIFISGDALSRCHFFRRLVTLSSSSLFFDIVFGQHDLLGSGSDDYVTDVK